jgi:hypothetical protein
MVTYYNCIEQLLVGHASILTASHAHLPIYPHFKTPINHHHGLLMEQSESLH